MKDRFVLLVLNKADLACEADYDAYCAMLGVDALLRERNGWFHVLAGSALHRPPSALPPIHAASEVAATLRSLDFLGDAVGNGRSEDPAFLGRRHFPSAVIMDDLLDAQDAGLRLEDRVLDWVMRFFLPWKDALARMK
jgi:hypothetical protein